MAKMTFLDFEQPIAELEAKIEELRFLGDDTEINIAEEIEKLRDKSRTLTTSIFASLTPWQITQLARHPQRPDTLDYVPQVFTEFQDLHGDRMDADDEGIVGGIARLSGQPVMLIGHQKGRDTKERVRRNYGMPKPEGYRKALRLMRMAEKFRMPVISFIDTPGAYPGVAAEQHGQGGMIARSQAAMARLRVPTVACVIGEGGSGGAVAIAVADPNLQFGRLEGRLEDALAGVESTAVAQILERSPEVAAARAKRGRLWQMRVIFLGHFGD